ncbi:hypothetical protein LEP1GSC061_2248 [Leptospira wolffii serovar Khorat str. Khorat-H2]|nr:hypothetical protein LEP1GSC061_2248 [Leptospira wolffii serovar Khorat str. Khorat-H2]
MIKIIQIRIIIFVGKKRYLESEWISSRGKTPYIYVSLLV